MKKLLFTFSLLTMAPLSMMVACSGEDDPNNEPNINTEPEVPEEPEVEEDELLYGMDFVADMGVGWNLGNTLDAHGDDETAWGNAYTTQEMIDMVKERGFNTLRIPVTWQFHLGGSPSYIVETAWLDRLEEVVNYGVKNDMYIIFNIHHDEDIIEPSYAKLDESIKIIESIWTQAANRFKNYNNKLIFEILNEMRVEGSSTEWSGGDDEGRDCINQFHAAAVAAIRATGGNNTERKIMLSTYGASVNETAMAALELPENGDNILVSLHSYTPYNFCLNDANPTTTWGTDSDMAELDNLFASIKAAYIDKGYAVVMGEWGSNDYDNDEARGTHASYYANGALENGICPIVWDDGSGFTLLNRHNYVWIHPRVVDAIINASLNY